jgi:hypothetical protein
MLQISRTTQKNSAVSVIRLITDHRLLMTTGLAFALSGCMGVYEGGFECPPGEGIKCKSISEVNQMVDQCSASSVQDAVPNVQSLTCGIPELRRKGSMETAPAIQTSEIWYSPFFENDHEESRKKKVLNDAISI